MTSMLGLTQAMLFALAVQTAPQSGAHTPAVRPQAVSPALPARPAEGWTWTLYEGDGPLVLAHEVPDTPHLRATLECAPGSSVVRLRLYQAEGADGFATVRSGSAAAEAEARLARGRLETAIRTDHPVFAAFLSSGRLSVVSGEHETAVEVDRPNLPKLRRFAELCTG